MRKEQYNAHYGRAKGHRSFTSKLSAATPTAAGAAGLERRKERQSIVQKTQSFLEYDNPLATPKTSTYRDIDFSDMADVTTVTADDESDDGDERDEAKAPETEEGPEFAYAVKISMLEIYNEQVLYASLIHVTTAGSSEIAATLFEYDCGYAISI